MNANAFMRGDVTNIYIVTIWFISTFGVGFQPVPRTTGALMNMNDNLSHPLEPVVMRRAFGNGWLARSPDGSAISIGVTAVTQNEAVLKFRSTLSRWVEILAAPRSDSESPQRLDVPDSPL